jgi:DMATS type aromatic prenyltransferase
MLEAGVVESRNTAGPGTSASVQRSNASFLELTAERLARLCVAVGFQATAIAEAVSVLEDLFGTWGNDSIGARPAIVSDVADDYSPIELSLALTGAAPEVRVLFEARGDEPTLGGRWAAGEDVNRRIARRFGRSFERLRLVQDLFVPTTTRARYAMWHGVSFHPSRAPEFKLYLNPQAQGRDQAPRVVREAVARLGFPRAVEHVATCRRTADEIKFFSLDIDDSRHARVKVYKVHHDASRADIERELGAARDHVPGAIATFWGAVAPGDGPFRGLPISTYLALTSDDERPTTGAVHLPVRDYWADDRVVRDRVAPLLEGLDRDLYLRGLQAFAARPLEGGVGMQSYVSLRQHRGHRRVTVYLAIEAYDVAAPSPSAARVRVGRGPSQLLAPLPVPAGTLTHDESERAAAASDIGGIISRVPGAVARPRTREEVQALVGLCRERGVPVAARGQAHTPFGQSQVPEGGLAIDLSALAEIRRVGTDRVAVGAGATWKEVIDATRVWRRAPPVLTAFQGLSVGGTLSVGGVSGV